MAYSTFFNIFHFNSFKLKPTHNMRKISIISGSIRTGRQSHKVSLFFKKYFEDKNLAEVEILDLAVYNFALFEERLVFSAKPTEIEIEFANKVANSDGVILISPEYNASYPASVKNAIDFLGKEWYHKPVAIVTVSSGNFGGVNANALLQLLMLRMKAIVVPASFPVPNIAESFNEEGEPTDKLSTYKRADNFTDELFWVISHFKT